MKRLFLFSVIFLAVTACDQYRLRKQTMSEYTTIFDKVQELERTIVATDFKTLSGEDLNAIYEIGGELYYDFNPLGLKPDQLAACEALKVRVKELKLEIMEKSEAEILDFKISPYLM